jgi:nicotinamidase-related amidase
LFPNIPRADIEQLQQFWGVEHPPSPRLGSRPALIVVDMVEGMVRGKYPPDLARAVARCLEANVRMVEMARQAQWPIFYTTTQCFPTDLQLGRWHREGIPRGARMLSEPGLVHEVASELSPSPSDEVFSKPKASAFFGTQLASMLNLLKVDSLIVTGMSTAGCVRATVVDAVALNYSVTIVADAVTDQFRLSHEVELFDMVARYAAVTTVEELSELVTEQ